MADSPSPFSAVPAFPGNATYQANVAALEHQYQTELAGDQEAMKDDWRNATYQRALMGKEIPEDLQANEAKMNHAGLLESGINSTRRSQIATAAAQKRAGITLKTGEDEGAEQRKGEISGVNTTDKLGAEVANATEKRKAEIEDSEAREPAAAKPAIAAILNPAGARVNNPVTGEAIPGTAGTGAVKVGYSGQGMAKAPPGYKWIKMPGGSYSLLKS